MKFEYLLVVFVGGGIGAVFRYLLSFLISSYFGVVFPMGTLSVNTIGSFLIGFFAYISEISIISPTLRVFIMIGVIGGFTTFSTFSLENVNLIRDGEFLYFSLNVIISLLLGVLSVILGYWFGEILIGRKV